MKIIGFKCTKCLRQFDAGEGGVCENCRKIYCGIHLKMVIKNNETKYYCEACIKKLNIRGKIY